MTAYSWRKNTTLTAGVSQSKWKTSSSILDKLVSVLNSCFEQNDVSMVQRLPTSKLHTRPTSIIVAFPLMSYKVESNSSKKGYEDPISSRPQDHQM